MTAAAHALAFDHIDIVKILPVHAFDTDHLNLDIKMTKKKNKNTELQKSENSVNIEKIDAMTNNKNDNKNENKNENENENEDKYDNEHYHGNSRSAYHIVCQWGSEKSLKFLLELNTIMTIDNEDEDETDNDNTNDGRNHIIINKLNRSQNENINENRVKIEYDDNNSNDNNDNSNNNKTLNANNNEDSNNNETLNTNDNEDSNNNKTLNTNNNEDSNNNKTLSLNTNKFTNRKNNLNIKMTDGTQPIHLAARYGHLNCMKILILNNAEINTIDCYGNTPFMLAKKWGRKECELYLSEMLLRNEII